MKAILIIEDKGSDGSVNVCLEFEPELKLENVEEAVKTSKAAALAFQALGFCIDQRDEGTEPIVHSITTKGNR